MRINGKCHCGEITFEAEIEADQVRVCHCTDCQALIGTAFRVAVPAPREKFKLLSGKPKTYVKTADDGSRSTLSFCGTCGSPIYSAPEKGSSYGIRVGCIEQRRELKPSRQIWCRSALPWAFNLEGIPKLEKQ